MQPLDGKYKLVAMPVTSCLSVIFHDICGTLRSSNLLCLLVGYDDILWRSPEYMLVLQTVDNKPDHYERLGFLNVSKPRAQNSWQQNHFFRETEVKSLVIV